MLQVITSRWLFYNGKVPTVLPKRSCEIYLERMVCKLLILLTKILRIELIIERTIIVEQMTRASFFRLALNRLLCRPFLHGSETIGWMCKMNMHTPDIRIDSYI